MPHIKVIISSFVVELIIATVATLLTVWSTAYFGFAGVGQIVVVPYPILVSSIVLDILLYYVYGPIVPFVAFLMLQRNASVEFKETPYVILAVIAGAVIGLLLGYYLIFTSLGYSTTDFYFSVLGPFAGVGGPSIVVLILSSILGCSFMFFRAAESARNTRGYALRIRRRL